MRKVRFPASVGKLSATAIVMTIGITCFNAFLRSRTGCSVSPLVREMGWMRTTPDQATVLLYSRQSYIDGHIDDPKCFQEDIVTVSLVSSALYWLANGHRACMQIVEPGDVVVLRAEARYCWKHGVA